MQSVCRNSSVNCEKHLARLFYWLEWQSKHSFSQMMTFFINPYSYFKLRKRNYFAICDRIFLDGILITLIVNFIYKTSFKRKSFDSTSIAINVFQDGVNLKKSFFFIGAKAKEIFAFSKLLNNSFPGIEIRGCHSGFFTDNRMRYDLLSRIVLEKPEIVIVGTGSPAQEKFLIDLRKAGFKGTSFSCGAFFSQTTCTLNYYPVFFNKLNLRWLYRSFSSYRLFFRYYFIYPVAVFFLLKDIFFNVFPIEKIK